MDNRLVVCIQGFNQGISLGLESKQFGQSALGSASLVMFSIDNQTYLRNNANTRKICGQNEIEIQR